MTTNQELPALRYDGLYEYAQAHRLDYNELCAVARASLAAQVEPIARAAVPAVQGDPLTQFDAGLGEPSKMHGDAKPTAAGVETVDGGQA